MANKPEQRYELRSNSVEEEETEILVGCDNLRKYETIIDLETNQVVFTYDKQKIPIKIINRNEEVRKMVNSTKLSDKFEYSYICLLYTSRCV